MAARPVGTGIPAAAPRDPRQEQDHQQAQQRVPGPPLRHFADPVFLEAGKRLDNPRQHDPVPTQWRRQPEGGSRAHRRKPAQRARNTSSGMNMPLPKLLRARPVASTQVTSEILERSQHSMEIMIVSPQSDASTLM